MLGTGRNGPGRLGGRTRAYARFLRDAFVVNLTDNAGERYLKAAIQLELSDPDLLPVVKEIKPKLRDAVIGILTSKAVKDVSTTEGKQRLKEEISYRLNSYLSKGKILQVYFTEFVIQ